MSTVNLPNLLTLLRILLTPLIIILLIKKQYVEALAVFSIASITDALDGLLARYLKQRTQIGAILDPIADKFLVTSTFVMLTIAGTFPDWLAVVVISRDVIIVAGVLVLFLYQGHVEIKPTFLSKATTCCQLAAIVLGMLVMGFDFHFEQEGLTTLVYLTAIVTVSSGLHYMYIGIRTFEPKKNGVQG